MKLIWHADKLIEVDWLHYLLGNAVDEEIVDLDCSRYDDDSIHVVAAPLRGPLSNYQRYFEQCRSKCHRIVLIHLSDEWFSGGYNMYRYFDLIIRWNHTRLADSKGILTIPLGYTNGTGHSERPVDQRRFAWSFVGEIKSSRIAMATAFDGLQPQFITGTDSLAKAQPKRLTKAEFDAVLADTIFAPCPMGNATIDTNRVYESLEFGCIPLVELRQNIDFYTNLLGHHPIPSFRTWPEARRFAEATLNDKDALVRMQKEIGDWWATYKAKLCAEIRTTLLSNVSYAKDLQGFSMKLRNRVTLVHEPLRIGEILRHQTVGSLARRLSRPIGPIKRIVRDTFAGHVH